MWLYIIGNGFDLHHDLHTGYKNYRQWLAANDAHLLDDFERFGYFSGNPENDRWACLEEALGVAWDSLCGDLWGQNIPNMSDESPGWDDFWIEAKERLAFFDSFTRLRFGEWVRGIDVSKAVNKVDLRDGAAYLSFNYTATLERLYRIPASSILHIHGSVLDAYQQLQFGSPRNSPDQIISSLSEVYSREDWYGASISLGIHSIAKSSYAAWKDLKGNYPKLTLFLAGLADVSSVCIMGHSYCGIDAPYYSDVIAPLFRDAEWVFCEYVDSREKRLEIDDFCRMNRIENYRVTGYWEFDLS